MSISPGSGVRTLRLVLLLITVQWFMSTEAKIKDLKAQVKQQEAMIQNLTAVIKQLNSELNNCNPASCKEILAENKLAASGIYWIQPTFNKVFQVYCDMVTQGGGWTLVYSYTFTNYRNFVSAKNAVTPRPSWPLSHANVPISTTAPLSESSLGAVNYTIWKEIGKEFMIKSNINDWLVCKPNGGSLIVKKRGPISCQNIKNVATACQGVVPDKVLWRNEGPYLYANSRGYYYFFDGYTHGTWPTHDPCDKDQPNHKKWVSNPGGQIYLR